MLLLFSGLCSKCSVPIPFQLVQVCTIGRETKEPNEIDSYEPKENCIITYTTSHQRPTTNTFITELRIPPSCSPCKSASQKAKQTSSFLPCKHLSSFKTVPQKLIIYTVHVVIIPLSSFFTYLITHFFASFFY